MVLMVASGAAVDCVCVHMGTYRSNVIIGKSNYYYITTRLAKVANLYSGEG